jgi:O-antigen/teichoic acid export membrane protein
VFSRLRSLALTSWRIEIASFRLLLSYGVRSYGVDILGALALQVDQVLVISLLTPAAMGIYGVALSLSRMFNLFQSSVVMVLFPRASGRQASEVLEMTQFSTRVSSLVTGGCAVIAAAVGPFLLRTLYGKEYSHAASILDLLLIEVTFSGAVFIMAQAYMALGRPGMVTIIQAIGLSLSIPLMLLLIPRWGTKGAAAALLVSTLARFLFVYFGFSFILKMPRPDLLPRLSDIHAVIRGLRRSQSRRGVAA